MTSKLRATLVLPATIVALGAGLWLSDARAQNRLQSSKSRGATAMVPTQNPLPPVPTTKILAISHFMGAPMTPAQRAQIMPHEVHDTVNAYLAGKIDQWYFRTDGKGLVFIVNASTSEEAKNILETFPLGQAGLMGFDYIPLGPLSPLRIINDMVK
jgi:hypothetical protein